MLFILFDFFFQLTSTGFRSNSLEVPNGKSAAVQMVKMKLIIKIISDKLTIGNLSDDSSN
jgi:hypothetical protein